MPAAIATAPNPTRLEWRPNPGPQEKFHASPADEVFYGGAAGGGKTESLVMEALRYVHVPGYTGIIFRRSFPELKQARGVIERAREYYPRLGGVYNESTFIWRFPAGSSIRFGHLENESTKFDHKSAEYNFIGFDELTTFTESQYIYLMSRLRSTAVDPKTGALVPTRIRSASNPGDVGHEWVKARFIDPLYPFEIGYFAKIDEVDMRVAEDHVNANGEKDAMSRQFIPATLRDNPKVSPEYRKRLEALPLLEREQLLNGNWDVLVEGNVFKSEWFKIIEPENVPTGVKWVRGWDLATSVKTSADWTASALVGFDKQANMYIMHMIRLKAVWPIVKDLIKTTALSETGITRRVYIEAKQHGLAAVQEFAVDPELVGVRIEGVNVDIDKLSRALPWSSRAEQGKVHLVKGPWNDGFKLRAALFDGVGTAPDDEIDCVSLVVQKQVFPTFRKVKFLKL